MVNGQLQVNFLWPFSLISPKLNTSHVQEILGLVPVFFLHCRPLPLEMLTYAREDTHYLLYIYDVLRNQLIQRSNEMKNLLRSVYTKSADLCGTVSLANFFFLLKKRKVQYLLTGYLLSQFNSLMTEVPIRNQSID